MLVALQIRAVHRSITRNLWPLTAYIYHVMIIVTGGFSKKSFFIIIFRSSHTQIFFKTGVVRNFAIFTGKHLCWSFFLIKFAGLSTSSQKRLQHRWLQQSENCDIFMNRFYFWNTSGGCFCQFDKVTVQWWATADLLFLIKNKIRGMVSTKKVCRSGHSMLFTHY